MSAQVRTHERTVRSFDGTNEVSTTSYFTEDDGRRNVLTELLFFSGRVIRRLLGAIVLLLGLCMWLGLFLFGTAIGRTIAGFLAIFLVVRYGGLPTISSTP